MKKAIQSIKKLSKIDAVEIKAAIIEFAKTKNLHTL